ncbi:hypothetical protein ACFVS2_26770 [Brevibacillus sp. NPDC058079]|uniref:hypothetical protein n=1 Tax=Brevibacillus sp. NPDC058079 TaxID=3346330 RepID=UPI0036E6081C
MNKTDRPWKGYHTTHVKNHQDIIQNGLLFEQKSELQPATELLCELLSLEKPSWIPYWLNRMECVFLSTEPQICEIDQVQFEVNLYKLEENRLFVADFELIDDLFQGIIKAIQNKDVSDIPTNNISAYWDSIRPYVAFLLEENSPDVELLYFGNIPPEAIDPFMNNTL